MAKAPRRAFDVTPMLDQFSDEHLPGNPVWGTSVDYLDAEAREAFRLSFRDGKIYESSGKLFDTEAGSTLHNATGRAIFVMDENGRFYASNNHEMGRFHHSSFFSGAPVAAAGEIGVQNGILKLISDKSGHYRPSQRFIRQALRQLTREQVKLSGVKKDLIGHDGGGGR